MKMKYILLLAASALGSMPAVAQTNYPTAPKTSAILIDGHGAEKGTASNPIIVSGSSGGGGSTPTGTAGSPNTAAVTVQGITGGTAIKVDGTATTQPISAVALPLPAGAATASGVAAVVTALGSPLQAGGSVAISNFPASLGAKAGAGSLSFTPATDLSNIEPAGAPITGQAMPAGGLGLTGWMSAIYKATVAPLMAGTAHIGGVAVDDVADGVVTSNSVTSAAVVVSASTAGFAGGSFQITSIGTGNTVAFEQSNDNVNWQQLIVQPNFYSTPSASAAALGIYPYVTSAAYVRARVSTYGSGTVSAVLAQKRAPAVTTGVSLAPSSQTVGTVYLAGTLPAFSANPTVVLGAGTASVGNVNTTTGYTEYSTALTANQIQPGASHAFNSTLGPQYSYFNAQSQADQAGTLYIEVSYDSGANFIPLSSVAAASITRSDGTVFYTAMTRVALTGATNTSTVYRASYKNGATANTVFRLTSSLTAN